MSEPSGSKMARALVESIGSYVWIHGDVMRLRTKSDAVIDSVDVTSVLLRRVRDGAIKRVAISDLSAVAMPKGLPAAVHGVPVPADPDTDADMVLVTDAPFDSVWPRIRESGSYFWRSSVAYDMYNRITVLGTYMVFAEDKEKIVRFAREVIELGRQALGKEPSAGDPSIFYIMGTAWAKLGDTDEANIALARALELHEERGGLGDDVVQLVTRDLGLGLAIRGVQNDDIQAQRRALELLERLQLSADDPAHELRNMLRDAVRRADAT